MKTGGKKFIALFLVFSLMMLSANLYAKERRGAKLMVTKKDGQLIEGELITVKENSLLLLDAEGKDVSVDIADIKAIKIVRKSKFWSGAGIGFLIGGGTVALLASSEAPVEEGSEWLWYLAWGVIFGAPCALIGGLLGAFAGTDKTIQIEGRSDLEIKEVQEKLRSKARIPDYK